MRLQMVRRDATSKVRATDVGVDMDRSRLTVKRAKLYLRLTCREYVYHFGTFVMEPILKWRPVYTRSNYKSAGRLPSQIELRTIFDQPWSERNQTWQRNEIFRGLIEFTSTIVVRSRGQIMQGGGQDSGSTGFAKRDR